MHHPIEQLFGRLASVEPYPPGVAPTTERIPGTAFFPGGYGLWGTQPGQPLPPMPVGGVLVLGHNFDSVASYERTLKRGCERMNDPTWGPLLALLSAVGIPPEECFFTNAYMGLKADNGRATGRFPGAKDPAFVRRCQGFLCEQLRLQQPRLVLTLGKEVPPVAAPLAPELTAAWTGMRSLPDLDYREVALVSPTTFLGVPHPVVVVALTHPANRAPNVLRRRYQELEGDAAEHALLRDALALALPNR